MRVGMKEPVHQDHLAEDVDQDPGDVPRIDSESTKRRDVRHAHPWRVLEHQHAPRAHLPHDRGNDHVGPGAELMRHPLGAVRLVDEVELERHVLLDLGDQDPEVEVRLEPAEQADEDGEVLEIDRHQVGDLRVLDLDRDLAPVAQPSAMDLSQRGGGERHRIEFREHVVERPSQFGAEKRGEPGEGPWRHPVLQAGEDLDVLRGQDVGARAEELTHLDRQALEARGEGEGSLRTPAMMACVAALLVSPVPVLDQLVAGVDARDERRHGRETPRPDEHRRIVRSAAPRRNALHSVAPPGKLRRRWVRGARSARATGSSISRCPLSSP